MLYFFKLLPILIKVDQNTVLTWFGIQSSNSSESITTSESSDLSLKTIFLIVEGLWSQVQNGLTLADIENMLMFIIVIRFIVLAIRYNLKTSFYIVCIGLFAGYLWYRHLIDLIAMYRSMLVKLPYLHQLGVDAAQLNSFSRQMTLTDLKVGDNVHWYNPGQLIYYAFLNAIKTTDSETGVKYYIDPISMILANLKESERINLLPIYYKIYNRIIPTVFEGISKFWAQLSGVAAYAVITRIGKRYCPYLVRWHWTFLLIIGFIEQIFIYLCYRISYFQSNIIVPKAQLLSNYGDQSLFLQVNVLNGLLTFIICSHLGLILFGLFHAISGQYFYFPFFVENTELHIGLRPKTSIYSGGYTSWQDEKDINTQRTFPKLWYGWFGQDRKINFLSFIQNKIKNSIKQIYKYFQR